MTQGMKIGGRPDSVADEEPAEAPVAGDGTGANPRARPPASAARAAWIVSAAEKIRALPGVLGATLHAKDGPVPGFGPRTPEEVAAASLLPASRRLVEALRLGRVILASGSGADRILLAVFAGEHALTVLLRDDPQADALKAQIRALLAPPH